MKKWIKWTLGIISVIILVIAVYTALIWSSIKIMMGTEGVDGRLDIIPAPAVSAEQIPLDKGDHDWISWLGAAGDRHSTMTGIKKDWSQGLKKLWEVNYLCRGEVSASWSAPVIQGSRLVICGRDSLKDYVFCLNTADASLIWHQSYEAKAIENHGAGSRATPAIDDDRVYSFGRSGVLACWQLLDGQKLWRQNVMDLGGLEPTWGHSSSSLIWQDLVIVQGGGSIRTIAFNKMTGETAWKSGNGLAGYTALTRMDIAGKSAVLSFHGKGLSAINLENGTELWNKLWQTEYDVNATTPATIGDSIFITSGYGTGCVMLKADSTKVEVLWQNKIFSSQHSDPYIIDGYLYGYSGDSWQNKGSFKCIDLKDGSEKWSTNDMGWGTCSFVDGHLVCNDIRGNLFLMKPDSEKFILVSSLEDALGDIRGPVWTKPVAANGRLYLRFKQKLVCYDLVN